MVSDLGTVRDGGKPTLKQHLIGDLAVARRHLTRLAAGSMPMSRAVLEEITGSIERCIGRIDRDVPDHLESPLPIKPPPGGA
jgi:hypothetical protein